MNFKRKLCLSLFLCLFISSFLFGQDRLVKINGDTLAVKISEITLTEIVYIDTASAFIQRKIDKSEIAFIDYENGIKEVYSPTIFSKIESRVSMKYAYSHDYPIVKIKSDRFFIEETEYDLRRILRIMTDLNDGELDKLISKIRINKGLYTISMIGTAPLGVSSILLLTLNMGQLGFNDPVIYKAIKILLGIDIGLLTYSVYLKQKQSKNVRKAILLYNTLIKEIPN